MENVLCDAGLDFVWLEELHVPQYKHLLNKESGACWELYKQPVTDNIPDSILIVSVFMFYTYISWMKTTILCLCETSGIRRY